MKLNTCSADDGAIVTHKQRHQTKIIIVIIRKLFEALKIDES